MAQLQRIVQGRSATLTHTFTSDGVATDPVPDTATYTITRADGTVLATGGATEAGTGKVTVTVTPTQTALLDTWTVKWTATFGGQAQAFTDTVEVAGGTICTLPDLGAVLTGLTAAQLAAKRTTIEQRIEKALGYAVVPRYALERRTPSNGFLMTRAPLRDVRSMTVDGIAYTTTQIDAFPVSDVGVDCVWSRRSVLIGYEHGEDQPDADIEEAALLLAGEMYGTGAVDQYVVRQEADNMAVTYSSPSTSGAFIGARLNQIIAANRVPAVA